jgi:hypothetical protein
MRPDEYEHHIASYFNGLGYKTKVSPQSGDYGVDVFATKGKEKLAIQAKMYGGSTRKVNRQMIMELHGAKDHFDCTRAILATDGQVIQNAKEVADKLGIEILMIPASGKPSNTSAKIRPRKFETIWEKEVMPLEGKTLKRDNGDANEILKVDWSGITRLTSNGRKQTIKIEIFRSVINHLIEHDQISREVINNEYLGRASSGVLLILDNTKSFEIMDTPLGLRKRAPAKQATKKASSLRTKTTVVPTDKSDINGITKYFQSSRSFIADAASIKPSPGIYAFFFDGDKFALDFNPKKTDIIYIGKTESSGISRVLNTHFGTGRTGSSTVRRSLSGLLLSQLDLKPIIRTKSDKEKGRYTFKLDTNSESTLTKWMEANLKVSFYPIPDIEDVKATEHQLIQKLKPILNLESNPLNPYKGTISQMRKQCAEIAFGERTIPSRANVTVAKPTIQKQEASRVKAVKSPRKKPIRTTKRKPTPKPKRKVSTQSTAEEKVKSGLSPLLVPILFFLLVLYALMKMY